MEVYSPITKEIEIIINNHKSKGQLVKLAYYMNVFYNKESNIYIKRALEDSENIKDQKVEFYKITKALDSLKEEANSKKLYFPYSSVKANTYHF